MAHYLLRFDGSYRGGCGGAGAAILDAESGAVRWEGARFVPGCTSSAAAEYEGLLLGLTAAGRVAPSATALSVEGDCSVVLRQLNGQARSRKLSKLHARATAAAAALPSPTVALVPREKNAHADALSRAAIAAAATLHELAVLDAARTGRRRHALELCERAGRDGVPRSRALFDALLDSCAGADDWGSLLSVYSEAQACSTARTSDHARAP